MIQDKDDFYHHSGDDLPAPSILLICGIASWVALIALCVAIYHYI